MLRFLHSGKLGDMLFALYAVKQLTGEIWFNYTPGTLCLPNDYDFCKPLLERQSYIHGVHKIVFPPNLSNTMGEKMFCRQDPANPDFLILDNAWYWRVNDRLCGRHWHWIEKYAYAFGLTVDPAEPILEGINIQDMEWEDRPIVTQLTTRYRTQHDSAYQSLLNRPDVIRIGDREGERLCTDMLEMANLIANSKFFMGNQSVCNSLAHGIQHPRLLEVEYEQGDAYPIGQFGFTISNNFEEDIVKMLEVSKYYWLGQ